MEQQKKSRGSFLKAGLLVGGALYAEPAAALARSGGHLLDGEMAGGTYFPKSTPIDKFVPGSYLPGNTGDITLGDFAGLAGLNENSINKFSRKFPAVTLGDIADCLQYTINRYGSDQTLIAFQSGERVMCGCCCCSCCVTITLNQK
jgi:hypothetical protein